MKCLIKCLCIASSERLPENRTINNLMGKHASMPFNTNIAHVFYLAGFIESWGRGIERICSACRDDKLPQPEYTINPEDIMIKFTAPEDRIVRTYSNGATERVTEKVTERVTEVTEKVTEDEQQILSLLLEDPAYTYKNLSEKLSISRKTVSVRIKFLKEKGLIKRIGSDTKGYWEILL